jgi:hypothetical protein
MMNLILRQNDSESDESTLLGQTSSKVLVVRPCYVAHQGFPGMGCVDALFLIYNLTQHRH